MDNDGNEARTMNELTSAAFLAQRMGPLADSQLDCILYCTNATMNGVVTFNLFSPDSPVFRQFVNPDEWPNFPKRLSCIRARRFKRERWQPAICLVPKTGNAESCQSDFDQTGKNGVG